MERVTGIGGFSGDAAIAKGSMLLAPRPPGSMQARPMDVVAGEVRPAYAAAHTMESESAHIDATCTALA